MREILPRFWHGRFWRRDREGRTATGFYWLDVIVGPWIRFQGWRSGRKLDLLMGSGLSGKRVSRRLRRIYGREIMREAIREHGLREDGL